jgi:NTE family protein
MLLKAIRDGEVKAVLLKMGNSIRDIDIKKGIRRDRSAYVSSKQISKWLRRSPTQRNLRALPPGTFDCLARHGYELAGATLIA